MTRDPIKEVQLNMYQNKITNRIQISFKINKKILKRKKFNSKGKVSDLLLMVLLF